jgi:FkbM family methyltransferase
VIVRTLKAPYVRFLELTGSKIGVLRLVNGARFRVLPRHRSYFTEDFNAPVAGFLRDRVKPGSVCINVGANVGVYTLQLANWSSPGGRVFSFEPNPVTAEILVRHVEMNGMTDRVEVITAAVGTAPGKAEFFVVGTDGRCRLGAPNPQLADRAISIEVDVVNLDGFCASRGILPDWLFIDVEGFETSVLQGAKELLALRNGGLEMVVEMHPQLWASAGTDRLQVERLLDELGLEARPLTGQTDPLGEYGLVSLAAV